MKYQIVGFVNNQLCLITLKPETVAKAVGLSTHQHGSDGKVTEMPTPEADRISREKKVDHSLGGVINKNKEEKK